jgi:hypothetical protein
MIRENILVSFGGEPMNGLRSYYTTAERREIDEEISAARIDLTSVIARVEEKTTALDRYVRTIRKEDHSRLALTKKIVSLLVMGLVPLIVALSVLLAFVLGYVVSENGRILAGFILVGCGLVVVLAIVSTVHVALQAAFHSRLLEKVAEERCSAFSMATIDFLRMDRPAGMRLIQHFRGYFPLQACFKDFDF